MKGEYFMSKLVGFRRFTSKKNGKDYCVAEVETPFNARETANGAVGCKTEQIFMPEDQYDFLKPEHIGKELKLDYELSGGRAYLVNVTVK